MSWLRGTFGLEGICLKIWLRKNSEPAVPASFHSVFHRNR
jgi:hypothetical protein